MHEYHEGPPRDHTRRWPHQERQRVRFTHNVETRPSDAAILTVLAQHYNVNRKAMLERIVADWLFERPIVDSLVRTELPQVEVRHG